jgi:hypothetical protein
MIRTNKRFACVSLSCLSLAGACLLLPQGCGPSPEKIAVREALLNREIEKTFERVQTLRSEDNAAGALALVEQALANPRYVAHKTRFFAEKIQLLLAQNNDAAAREAVLAAWKREPECARVVFDTIHSHLRLADRHADVRAWCRSLLDPSLGLPADLRGQVLGWQLDAALSLADPETAKTDLDALLAGLKPAEAAPFLNRALGDLIDAGRYPLADALLRHLEAKKLQDPLYLDLLASLSLRCALGAKEWDKLPAAFDACVARLPDEQLHKLSRAFFSMLQKNDKTDLLEQASKKAVFNAAGKTNSVNYASRVWVECGVSANKNVLPERLDALLNADVSPVHVGNLYDQYFYAMTEHTDIIRNLCAVGERLIAACPDTNTVNAVKVKVLDGAFITEDYDLAVSMLEKGIPGKDKAWHDMSLPKVKAHRAMARNQPREAVGFFRAFMDAWIASDQEEEFDPTSGIAYSREWILGRNAKRIAGLLDGIPDKAEADKARAEAKAYFKTALEKAANDPEALKLLKEETKGLME